MKKLILFLILITSLASAQVQYGGQVVIKGVTFALNAANSSSANLAAGASFTGTITSSTNSEPNIQISVASNENIDIVLQQFNDVGGTQLVSSYLYHVLPGVGLNQNLQLVGNFFRVVATNRGIATTTLFSLQVTTGLMDVGSRNYIEPPQGTDEGMGVRLVPQINWRTTYARVLASTWDAASWNRVILGGGQVNSQSAGNGVITSGTTVNAETILRSKRSFSGSFLLRQQTTLSQRIANQNFIVELVDVIGDGLAITVNSATSVTVTIPSNPFTADNVGQSMNIGAATGFTGVTAVPGRYAIASVAGNNVTFTVAGWATGGGNTGTCSLFGWNYHQLIYNGTTATNVNYDAQRRGWNSGATVATINTTAAPGHMAVMGSDDGNAYLSDQLIASTTVAPLTVRASRVTNIAEETADLWLQVRCVNGTTAPASTTTWTIGTISVENYSAQNVTVSSPKATGSNTQTPVRVDNTVTVQATNLSTNTAQINGVAPTMGSGASAAGTLRVMTATDAAINIRGGIANGTSTSFLNSAATTNATLLKASAGTLYSIFVNNASASAKFLRVYNLTVAPTVGTSSPILVVTIPANTSLTVPINALGLAFSTGMSYAITNAAAYLDATAVAAGDVQVLFSWQ